MRLSAQSFHHRTQTTMGAPVELLVALMALLCIDAPVFGSEGCNGFRHLENGQTFFRYGGLLVIFRCHPGYKLHGYKSNSCVLGSWSRDTPVCVGSGCSSPGSLTHGMSSMNEDGSWAVFSCNHGFRLHGPSVLYCKGHTWNGTKPVCKETDMMSPFSITQKPTIHQNLQTSPVLQTQPQTHRDTTAETSYTAKHLKFGMLSHTPSLMSNSERIENLFQQQQQNEFPTSEVSDKVHIPQLESQEADEEPESGTRRPVAEVKASGEEAGKVPASKSHKWTTVTPTLSLVSQQTERSTASPPSFSTVHTSAITAVSNAVLKTTYPAVTFAPLHSDKQSVPEFVDKGNSLEASSHALSASAAFIFTTPASPASPARSFSAPIPSFPAFTSSSTSSTQTYRKISDVTLPSNPSSEYHNLAVHVSTRPPFSLSRCPACPVVPVPPHGTFSFHQVINPDPSGCGHFIQYACNPGYQLAHGDAHSFCQEGGTWSGSTPVCLDLDECVEKQHPCQQRCINTFGSYRCSCDDGYQPAHDHTYCTDVNECLLPAAVMGCVFGCVNTAGSFHCKCPAGYYLQSADGDCEDIDECVSNQGLGPCMEHCHNTPGSYRCSCRYGYILAGDSHSCIAECPPGYRKQQTATPENSTASTLREECVDVNECLEEVCDWQCVNLPGTHRCICPRGYSLQGDGQSCKDINECSRKNGGCSHLCVNLRGGYKCVCPASHRLSPYSWKKCIPRATINAAG